jgi:hypothetical protein
MTAYIVETAAKKSVRFAENNELFQLVDEYEVVPDEIWFSSEDYVLIKSRTRAESKEWRKLGHSVLLSDTFETPRQDAQEYITAFCQLEGELSRRGLERHLSRQHGEERSELKDRARQSVLIHQRRLNRQGLCLADVIDQLAYIYRDMTRPAKTFARRLGKADELVACVGEDNTAARIILEAHQRHERSQKMERRLSNFSVFSANSFDSKRKWAVPRKPRCPGSPATPMEEYYAAIA